MFSLLVYTSFLCPLSARFISQQCRIPAYTTSMVIKLSTVSYLKAVSCSLYSSVFRELKKYQKEFSTWCGECQREKKERQRQSLAATKLVNFISVQTIIPNKNIYLS